MRANSPDVLHVAVGVIRDPRGNVLIAQRPPGVHLAGLWEFPGGKVKHGEFPYDALRRELMEELSIAVECAEPLIKVRHAYPERRVLLDVWQVSAFSGQPMGLQGQSLRWVEPDALPGISFPAANRPITTAARLPDFYGILDSDSPDPGVLAGRLERLAERGLRLIQMRAKGLRPLHRYVAFAKEALASCRARGITLLLNADPFLVEDLGAEGVHLTAARLMALSARPLRATQWVAASCHDFAELEQAERIGVDFAVLSPVMRTATHHEVHPLGWGQFAGLVDRVNVPVYALGGLDVGDLARARRCGGQGIAAIRGFLL